jgi:thiol:disulfide interchange protein
MNPKKVVRTLLISLTVLSFAAGAWGQFAPGASPNGSPVSINAAPSHKQATAGQTIHLAVEIHVKPGWVFYSPNPGTSNGLTPKAGEIIVRAEGGGLVVGGILWPSDAPHKIALAGTTYVNNAYEGDVVAYAPLTVPQDAKPGKYVATVTLDGQACGDESCVPLRDVQVRAEFVVGNAAIANPVWTGAIANGLAAAKPADRLPSAKTAAQGGQDIIAVTPGADYTLLGGFALAMLAGLMLNIMPCVLPVIPLKILGMVQQAGESRRRYVTLGLAFAAGMVLFFVGVALFNVCVKLVPDFLPRILRLIGLQSTGQTSFTWGEHFQSIWLRITVACLLLLIAANLFFNLLTVLAPKRAGAAEAALSQRKGHLNSFGMGFLTGVLATPCSFYLLVLALGFAQAQTLLVGSLAITTIGVGMALPYALPGLLKYLPRPGRWMEIFKQTMGFAMLLAVVWLLSTLSSSSRPFWIAAFAVLLAMSVWMWFTWVRAPGLARWIVRAAAAAIVIASGVFMLPPPRPLAVTLVPFDQARIDQARRDGRIVLVDFTASWCVNCKQVEWSVYDNPQIASLLKKLNVLAVKGDISTRDLPANALKEKFGQGIPVTVIFPPAPAQPVVLNGLFSREQLVRELHKATRQPATTTGK